MRPLAPEPPVMPLATAVCVVGSVNVDTTYRLPRLPLPGETLLAVGRSVAPGGKGANQAVTAAGLGSRVTMLGCVGDDPEADLVTDSLRRRGVEVAHLVRVPGSATGTAVILVDEQGENMIAVDAGANRRLEAQAVAAHLAAASYDVILAQLEVELAVVLAAAKAKGGAIFILNPAPMTDDRAALRELLAHTDVLVPNRQELGRLAGERVPGSREELERCVARLDFAGVVVVTLGADGAAVYDPGQQGPPTFIEAVPVQTVDTTGAGDAFCGALGHFLAQHGDIVRAAREANQVAALSTTVPGAQVPAELLEAVRQGR